MITKYKLLVIFICLPFGVWIPAYCWFNRYIHLFLFPQTISALLIMLFLSPVLEEIVFRGLLQDVLLKHARRRWPSLLLLNILFVLLHYHINANVVYLLLVFSSGVIFSYTKLRYTKLVYPISLHIYYNFIYVAMLSGLS